MSNRNIKIYKNILSANDQWSNKIKSILKEKNIRMYNIIGSPGSGKTTLLESILKNINSPERLCVLEGDVETANDAERLSKYDIQVSQMITSGGCHLEAQHIFTALNDFDLNNIKLIIIENVGNLVCPAEFDLGETAKIAVLSVTEGEDKPVKYPMLFREAKAVIITKVDLLPYLDYDLDKCINYIKNINYNIPIFKVSSKENKGIKELIDWII